MLLIDLIDTWQGKPEHQDEYYNITLANRLATRYLKIHVKYDDRDIDFKPKNKATFLADLANMLGVYQEATSRTDEFRYDEAGNRTLTKITLIQPGPDLESLYYANSARIW
jgi:hypothetical protein